MQLLCNQNAMVFQGVAGGHTDFLRSVVSQTLSSQGSHRCGGVEQASPKQNLSAPETEAEGIKDSAKQALHVIDNTVFQLYLVIGVNPRLTRENVKPVNEAARRILFSELRDIFSNLTSPSSKGTHILAAQTTHHLMELFTSTVSYEPAQVLQFVRDLLRAFNWGYQFDSMAKDEVVKFADIILADHKDILREPPNAVNMEAILAVFVEAGWPEATQLLMKLDSAVR